MQIKAQALWGRACGGQGKLRWRGKGEPFFQCPSLSLITLEENEHNWYIIKGLKTMAISNTVFSLKQKEWNKVFVSS